jgi:Flp pilus assembly pilin Flp
VGEIEMDTLKRRLRDRFDGLAIEYCLIAAVILVAIIAGVHSLAGR